MKISEKKAVIMHYTLKNDNGEVLDSSEGSDPLSYVHGHGQVISGLENALTGKKKGDKLDVSIDPKDAYGIRDEKLVQVAPLSGFKGTDEIKVGNQYQIETPEGVVVATVTNLENEEVTLDMNHPLSGETLHFNVEIVDVRDASEEELNPVHVHGPDCDHDH